MAETEAETEAESENAAHMIVEHRLGMHESLQHLLIRVVLANPEEPNDDEHRHDFPDEQGHHEKNEAVAVVVRSVVLFARRQER